jgi:hypothetical protein
VNKEAISPGEDVEHEQQASFRQLTPASNSGAQNPENGKALGHVFQTPVSSPLKQGLLTVVSKAR